MPPKKTRSMLTADEARAQKASKAAEKAAQADRNRAKSVAASEKADREKRMREKKEQVAAAKAAREAAKAAAKLPPSGKAEKELMKIVKRGDEAQDAGDFEAALESFQEAMAGFVKLAPSGRSWRRRSPTSSAGSRRRPPVDAWACDGGNLPLLVLV